MDALLRAYGKRPRPGVELHPAARRALQDEVKTVFGRATRPRPKPIWAGWWLRLPLAGAFAAVAVMLILQNRRYEKAQHYSREAGATLAGSGHIRAREANEVARESRPMASPGPAPGAGPMSSLSTARAIAPSEPAGATNTLASAPPATFGEAAQSDMPRPSAAVVTRSGRRASQVTPPIFKSAPPAPVVLDTFRVQRQGENVLVTDGDGSVYRGKVVKPTAEATGKPSAPGEENSYTFSVQGVNQSLRQPVNFHGRVAVVSKAGDLHGAAPSGRAGETHDALQSPESETLRASSILGRAVTVVSGIATVGATNRVRIEATSPTPMSLPAR